MKKIIPNNSFVSFFCCLALAGAPALHAWERHHSPIEAARRASYVAVGKVIMSRTVPGLPVQECEVELIEALKGNLPAAFTVRFPLAMETGMQLVSPGKELVFVLGPRHAAGFYPAHSLSYGKIPIQRAATGFVFEKSFSGSGAAALKVSEFKHMIRSQGKEP